MPTTRITYHDLPHRVRSAIEEVTGPGVSAVSATEGFNSAVAARLSTPTGDRFCKALPSDHPWVWTQSQEAAIAPYLKDVAPDLLAHLEVDGWDVLLFDALDGHHADYRPGSLDLSAVATLLETIAAIPCPPIDLRDAGQRLRNHVSNRTGLHHLTGPALLHTDLNPANIIIDAGRARIVDWGWASRGAPWLDAAYWVVWLVSVGHDPTSAEHRASAVRAWRAAPADGVSAFAHAQAALWNDISSRKTDDEWVSRLAAAATRWARHRQRLTE